MQWQYPTEQPTLLLLNGIGLLQLGRTPESAETFEAASRAADALLELHDGNVAALHARALALCGLAVATGDANKARDAAAAFTRARAVTTAAGVTTASLQLLDQIRRNDHERHPQRPGGRSITVTHHFLNDHGRWTPGMPSR